MDDEKQEPPYGPAFSASTFSFPVPCPECRGSVQILLLTSSRACRRCGGAGRLGPAGGEAGWTIEAPDGSVRTYDRIGRLIVLAQPRRGQMCVWRPIDGIRGHATLENDRPAESQDGEPMGPEPGAAALCAECSGTGYVTFRGGGRRCSRCRSR